VNLRGHANPARTVIVWCIRCYQNVVSPALPRSCKYHPSCSQYAIDAVSQHGVLRGLVLASWRLLRCNPLSYGGYDPVERQTLFAGRARTDDVTLDGRGVNPAIFPDGGPGRGAGSGAVQGVRPCAAGDLRVGSGHGARS
jgi:putative membrane protein insertion efficiency factor